MTAVNPNIYVFKLWEDCGKNVCQVRGTPENSGLASDWKLELICTAFNSADKRLEEKYALKSSHPLGIVFASKWLSFESEWYTFSTTAFVVDAALVLWELQAGW